MKVGLDMKQPTQEQQQKQKVKSQLLSMFQQSRFDGIRSGLRKSDVWHDYAQIAKCGDLELAVSLSNREKIRIRVRSHNTDQNFLVRIETLAYGKISSIHNDTSKKSCDLLELKENFDWRNLGPSELATLQGDIQVMARVWNNAINAL